MNTQINLLLSAVKSLGNGRNPFVNGFIKTEKASKTDFLFVLNTFVNAVKIVSDSNPSEISIQASLDFKRAYDFLSERVKFKENIIITDKFHFINPLSNKWSKNKDFNYDTQLSFWVLVINEINN